MNQKRSNVSIAVSVTVASLLVGFGCAAWYVTSVQDAPKRLLYSAPTTSTTPTAQPTSPTEPSASPVAPEPVTVDLAALDTLVGDDLLPEGSEGYEWTALKSYAVAQVGSPKLLSGAWWEDETWIDQFAPIFGKGLLSQVKSLKVSDPEDTPALHSVGAFFKPSKLFSAPASCTPDSTDLSDCLSGTLSVRDVSIDKAAGMGKAVVKVEFTTEANQRLVKNDTNSETLIPLRYDNTVWVDVKRDVIVAIENSFTFGLEDV